jgi:hypothetical protein
MAEAKGADIQSVYVEKRVFDPTKEFVEKARLKNMDEYKKMWERSIEDPEGIRGEMGEGVVSELGDASTLADLDVAGKLVAGRQ